MILEVLRSLHEYSDWANRRVLDTAEQLTPEQFVGEAGPSHGSVRNTLVHQMSGQWIWLERWKGVSPARMLSPKDFPDLTSVRGRWQAIEADTQAFAAGLDEQKLEKVISYTTTEGYPRSYPLWRPMFHQLNHSTAHRSEAAVMLTNFGHSPGDLDYVVYLAKMGEGVRP
ncbi:MAG TPA: DinB family protein [Anaerolineales bacterium]